MTITIQPAAPDEISELVAFVMAARAEIYPMLDSSSHSELAERELANFQKIYLDHPDGAFFTARANGALVATAAYVTYNHRFPQLGLEGKRIVEVVRLYVSPVWRRAGVASRLFAALRENACQAGIERLYLHTHPFLPGAIRFWERQGFRILDVEDDPIWKTTHMALGLTG